MDVSSPGVNLELSTSKLGQMAAVFVDRSHQPAIMHAHLPMLIKAASFAAPACPPIRLVMLPPGAHGDLSAALNIPRVSMIGVMGDAPDAAPLLAFVRRKAAPAVVPWMKDMQRGAYLPVAFDVAATAEGIQIQCTY